MTKLCPRGKAAAKRKFKVYPSAYANAYASKICAGKIKDPSGVKRKDFRGPKLHSHEYKRPEPFQDKRVLVIGIFYAKCFFPIEICILYCQFYPLHIFIKRNINVYKICRDWYLTL